MTIIVGINLINFGMHRAINEIIIPYLFNISGGDADEGWDSTLQEEHSIQYTHTWIQRLPQTRRTVELLKYYLLKLKWLKSYFLVYYIVYISFGF